MQITALTSLAFYLNAAMDSGRHDDLAISEVQSKIENGTIFDFLRQRLGSDIDLSILKKEDEAELLAEWRDFLATVNARRKMGVEMRGLPLLIAYLLEGIQRRLPR
ncbi:hypothetical protein M2322_004406 [Rhodoblastus acidophilus]|uniref:hypothetical protein n=1 Tax=Rhodoblastus acidophilus TaxID=1074 RepID=UPI0022256364|nr:hypothetical protein [Rhodoblastus acidophilus]MCW2318837.1 hypothetical protein [Rhodoblastus acidophilus]